MCWGGGAVLNALAMPVSVVGCVCVCVLAGGSPGCTGYASECGGGVCVLGGGAVMDALAMPVRCGGGVCVCWGWGQSWMHWLCQ